MNTWKYFYENRINSSYQDYFEKKYAPFLNYIRLEAKKQLNPLVNEIGCGIGSVSKYLLAHNINCIGFDLSPDMVSLANRNVNTPIFTQGDLFTVPLYADTINVSHGVLEHFSDETLVLLRNKLVHSIHYVPLDKYKIPSFGDERLLSVEHWVELLKPKDYFTFNDGYDLCFTL